MAQVFNILFPIKGGEELKFVKGIAPESFFQVGEIVLTDDAPLINTGIPFNLDDELHKKLSTNKGFTTYILLGIAVNDGVEIESEEMRMEIRKKLVYVNVAEQKEFTYKYQILEMYYIDTDDVPFIDYMG